MPESAETINTRDVIDSKILNDVIYLASSEETGVRIFNKNIENSVVINNVTVLLSKSLEYQNLVKTRERLEKILSRIPEEEEAERLEISAELNHQKKVIREFIKDVLAVAEQFSRIQINTERLRRAKDLFDQGKFSEARAILEMEVEQMRNEQTLLLVKREEYKTDILPKLKANSEEFFMLAMTTRADYTLPNRFEAARDYHERSIESYASESNVFHYAYYLASNNQFAEAEKYYRRYLDEFPAEISREERAMILNNLGNQHTSLNKYDEALKEFDEALQIYRALAKTEPKTYLPDVAMSLSNLSSLHINQTRYDEALNELAEALQIYRDLVAENDDAKAYLFGEAQTLNNLGNAYKHLHGYDEASKNYEEALRIYRSLAETEPKQHRRYVAVTLSNLALLHKNQEKFAEAAREYAEALEIYRDLSAADPHMYLPLQSGTLINLASLHQAQENYADALKEYEEALKTYRALAEANPDAYRLYVAMITNNLAVLHLNEQRLDEASQRFDEALQAYRALAETNSEAYQPYVAGTLNNLAALYFQQSRYEEALQKLEETLKIYTDLHAQSPEAYAPDLAKNLLNLATCYQAAVPDREKSIAYAAETIIVVMPLRQTVPIAQTYTRLALDILINWGLTDKEIQRLVMEKPDANQPG